MWWWAVSLLLIAVGVLGFVFVPRSAPVGPSIAAPFGNTDLLPSATSTTTTLASPASMAMSLQRFSAELVSSRVTTTTKPQAPNIVLAPAVSRSIPVHLTIPAIGVSVGLSQLGLNRDHTVSVPKNYRVPGWYKYGPAPGQKGSAVILGHVDSYRRPAVFYRLAKLRLHDRVIVKLRNGRILHFSVIGMRMYSKKNFPDHVVYGPRNYSALQLVTCGGVFDTKTGHYLSNIVVFTAMVTK